MSLSTHNVSFGCGLLFCLCVLGDANAANNVVFWLEPLSNMIIDRQVAGEIGNRAGLIVLRAANNSLDKKYTFPEMVRRLKEGSPQSPVLSYAWANASTDKGGRIEADLLKGAATRMSVAEITDPRNKRRQIRFLDVTNASLRRSVVDRLRVEQQRLGVDGFAIDRSMRTPFARPEPIAKVCRKQAGYCKKYSQGMDELFASLQASLGKNSYLAYNGLWNFEPGMLEDQAKLLDHANAVAVEYFGMNPDNKSPHNFSNDVLPYLKVVSRLPKNKAVLVFGRSPLNYMNYTEDYRWQRYLFASFLLAKRDGDLFKYLASFSIPGPGGRACGLDAYGDWSIDLGESLGPYSVKGGLYRREFVRGLVAVAPDDGAGGKIRIAGKKYSLEGEVVVGEVSLSPGEALILFNELDKSRNRPVSHVYTAQGIASWGWSSAELKKMPEGDRIKLTPLPAQLEGEHDMLLDYERSLAPYERLEINAKLLDSSSAIFAVAEVDDPNGKHMWLVLEISRSQEKLGKPKMRVAVNFRMPTPRKGEDKLWPLIHIEHKPDDKTPILLDGSKVLKGTDYRFRRWSHVRFAGSLEVSEVSLSAPNRINMQNMN